MGQTIEIHPSNPDTRVMRTITASIEAGAVMAYPTDSGYALGCGIGLKEPLKRIKRIRHLDEDHNFTLIVRDLSELSRFARVSNADFKILKRCTPGGYTFILNATNEVPKLMLHAGKKTIGIRIPDHPAPLAIADAYGKPVLSTTLIMPGSTDPLVYPEDVADMLGHDVDMIIDCGYCGFEPTTVVDLTQDSPIIQREGCGDTSYFS